MKLFNKTIDHIKLAQDCDPLLDTTTGEAFCMYFYVIYVKYTILGFSFVKLDHQSNAFTSRRKLLDAYNGAKSYLSSKYKIPKENICHFNCSVDRMNGGLTHNPYSILPEVYSENEKALDKYFHEKNKRRKHHKLPGWCK